MKKVKQISYITALMIVVSSAIGVGIFIKNKSLFQMANGSLGLVLAAWTIAGVGMIALGLAIGEMISASRSNAGILEWFDNFMPKWLSKSSKNYVQLLFVPVTLFTMPLYAVQSMQDAGLIVDQWQSWAIGLGIFMWIAVISLIGLKTASRFQWITSMVKFIPIVIIPIFALMSTGTAGSMTHKSVTHSGTGLLGIAPAMVLIGGIPAIAFAFDGFYEASSLRNELKDPKRMGPIIAIGVSIILAIYMIITVTFAAGSTTGNYDKIGKIDTGFMKALNIMIGIGILGIANAYMMASLSQNTALYENDDTPLIKLLHKGINKLGFKLQDKRLVSWIFIFITTLMFFLVFGPIGMYAWTAKSQSYGSADNMYEFIDILVNYTSSLTFGLITIAVIGTLINRVTNRVKVSKKKYFIPTAVIASIIILAGIIMQFVVAIVDLTGYNNASAGNAAVELYVFAGIIAISVLLGLWETYIYKGKTNKKETESLVLKHSKNKR